MIITERERVKYERAWGLDNYSDNSPGADFVPLFMSIVKPARGQSVYDIGAGHGAASRALKDAGLDVHAFDLTSHGWPHSDIPIMVGTVWKHLGWGEHDFDYGYCCDVMEHLPTQFVALSISEILRTCRQAFFSICFKQDVHGDAIRDRLHLTVESFSWWRDTFREIGYVHEARDLIGDGVFLVGK